MVECKPCGDYVTAGFEHKPMSLFAAEDSVLGSVLSARPLPTPALADYIAHGLALG